MKKSILILTAIVMAVVFSDPAKAARELEIYGSVHMGTWKVEHLIRHNERKTDSDQDIEFDLAQNTCLGFKIKAGSVSGHVEISPFDREDETLIFQGANNHWMTQDQLIEILPASESGNDEPIIATGSSNHYAIAEGESNFRLWYATWDFGVGEVLIGQAYTPMNLDYSNATYLGGEGNWGYGLIMEGREPMIQFKFDNFLKSGGTFKLAVVKHDEFVLRNSNLKEVGVPYTNAEITYYEAWASVYYDVAPRTYSDNIDYDVDIPKIELSYNYDIGPFSLDVVGAYFKFEMVETELYTNALGLVPSFNAMDIEVEKEHDITCYHVGVGARTDLGPAYINFSYSMGQNPASMGTYFGPAIASAVLDDASVIQPDNTNNLVRDVDFQSGFVAIGGKVNDMLELETGFGFTKSDYDAFTKYFDDTGFVVGIHREDRGNDNEYRSFHKDVNYHWYVLGKITLADGVYFIPEFGQYKKDYEVTSEDYKISVYDPIDTLTEGFPVYHDRFPAGGEHISYFEDDTINYVGANMQIDF